jgi:hypothetical protein
VLQRSTAWASTSGCRRASCAPSRPGAGMRRAAEILVPRLRWEKMT